MRRIDVAVDVGNFAIKARFFQPEAGHAIPLGEPVRVNLQPIDWRDLFAQWYQQQITTVAAEDVGAVHWRVASVNSPPTRLLKTWVETSLNKPTDGGGAKATGQAAASHHWREFGFREIPLKLDIRHPESVGIDRLIAAWAAWRGSPEATEPSGKTCWVLRDEQPRRRRPVIVADAGSALTVDLVDAEGRFRGGAIVPGRQMQLRSLGLGTFALPDLTTRSETLPDRGIPSGGSECPGRDTQAAIQLGVFAGMAGAVDRLRDAYQHTLGESPELVLTGGDAPFLAPAFDQQAYWVPHLLLDALAWL